jgi:hypothetical protein
MILRCEGKRRQWRKNVFGAFKCMRKAKIVIETHVGFTEHHYACDDPECYGSISCGYPTSVQTLSPAPV